MKRWTKPGEWYLNRAQGKLYYIPVPGEDMSRAEVIAPVGPRNCSAWTEIRAEGKFVEHLKFKGLRFVYTEFSIPAKGYSDPQAAVGTPATLQFTGARWCELEECEVAHAGAYGVFLRAGCQDNRIVHNAVYDLGAGGVRAGETENPKTPNEAVLRNVIDNNFIHDGGHVFLSGVGVFIARSSLEHRFAQRDLRPRLYRRVGGDGRGVTIPVRPITTSLNTTISTISARAE